MMRFSQGSPYPTHIWRIRTMGIPTGLLLQLSGQATSEFPCFLFFFFTPHPHTNFRASLSNWHTCTLLSLLPLTTYQGCLATVMMLDSRHPQTTSLCGPSIQPTSSPRALVVPQLSCPRSPCIRGCTIKRRGCRSLESNVCWSLMFCCRTSPRCHSNLAGYVPPNRRGQNRRNSTALS